MYKASNWKLVGRSRGYSRSNGRYGKPHDKPRELYVYPLRRDEREMLRDADVLGEQWKPKRAGTKRSDNELRSLYEELCEVEDFRRAQGRKHSVAYALSVYIFAFLSGMRGPTAAQYARNLSGKELEILGAWYNRKKGRYDPISKSTMHRVVTGVDPQKLQAVVARYSAGRGSFSDAIAIDGRHIRGANGNGEEHCEVVTVVEHGSGIPLGSIDVRDQGAEGAAVSAALEQVSATGRVITVDTLHTTKKLANSIVRTHGNDYVFTVKSNCSLTYDVTT